MWASLKTSVLPLSMPLGGSSHTPIHNALPFTYEDYFELICQAERCVRNDKRGFIASHESPIFPQLGIDNTKWIDHVEHFRRHYGHCAGSVDKLIHFAECTIGSGVKAYATPLRPIVELVSYCAKLRG